MRTRICFLLMIGAASLSASAALCQTAPPTPEALQARFDQEPDAMRRARLLMEMSRVQFKIITEKVASGDNTDALKMLQQLVDDEQKCSDQLDAREPNPEAHPGGFKQLQIATRESLRRLDDITVALVADEQTPFLAIRGNLDQLNRHLIRELFPHQPQPGEAPQNKDHDNENSPASQGVTR
jgi:hypothetical protein